MKSAERRMKIYEMVMRDKYVEIKLLAEQFHVSAMTVRRDLARLEEQGIVNTSYGGATLREGVSSEPSFGVKSGHAKEYKTQIAYEASLLIKDGDSIFIDCGTTTKELARFITRKKITVITNSWSLLSAIHDFSKCKIILAPGEYDPISAGALSSTTIHFLQDYTVDKAFLSTQGIDLDIGATVPMDRDAQVKKAILQSAKHNILLADHTKFGKSYLARHAGIKDFEAILTDIDISQDVLEKARKMNIPLTVCKSYQKAPFWKSSNTEQ